MTNHLLEDAALERANRIFNNLPTTSQNKDWINTDMGPVFRGWGLDPQGYWIGMWVFRQVARCLHFVAVDAGLGFGVSPWTGGSYTLDEVKHILVTDCVVKCHELAKKGLLEEGAFKDG